VQQRLPSLRDVPIAFAHRGARAHAPENTLQAFTLALKLGATGIESDAWLTSDNIVVLDHDGVVRRGLRRVPISEISRANLPTHIPTLQDLITTCGDNFDLSLDLKDVQAFLPTVQVLHDSGFDMSRVWLCHWDVDVLLAHRPLVADVRLVDSTRFTKIPEGLERRAHKLRQHGIDAINLHYSDWTGGLATLVHRFDVMAFGWDLQFESHLTNCMRMGLDAVYSDYVDRMMDVYRDVIGNPKAI
jgi:glycerophosphoryl diester phosphodiesterase